MADAPTQLRGNRYTILGTLGQGGQGVTLDAIDESRGGKPVAVKRFDVRGAASWKDVELAEREARVLASLDHPALPRYVEHFEEGGALYLVTDKIEGESLAALTSRAPMSEEGAWHFLAEANDALTYLHQRGAPIVHRDIKPTNVIRRPGGAFAFIDFGAVRDHLRPEGGSTVVGTFGYMAPEQFQGRALPASDVYATAVTTLVALTAEQPERLPHKGLRLDARAALGGRVSERLVRTLEAMLEPDPDQRPTRIGPLLEADAPAALPQRMSPGDAGAVALVAARARSPYAGIATVMWAAWGVSWWLLHPNWLYMMVAMMPILVFSRWAQRDRAATTPPAMAPPVTATRPRVAVMSRVETRARVVAEVVPAPEPAEEEGASESAREDARRRSLP